MLAYLVKCQKMDLKDAVRMVKERRDVRPNAGFLEQLIAYEQKCKE